MARHIDFVGTGRTARLKTPSPAFRGVTLVELLTVLAIVTLLIAVAYPIIASARLAGKRAATISNLRQCGVALAMYADEAGDIPNRASAYEALGKAPICDANDGWLGSRCPQKEWQPLVGSYGYIRSTEAYNDDANWRALLAQNPNPRVMASIHYATYPVASFKGDRPEFGNKRCISEKTCIMPDVLITVYLDTSAKRNSQRTLVENSAGASSYLFDWAVLFDHDWSGK